MATRFEVDAITYSSNWTVLYQNAQGYQDKYLQYCKNFVEKSEFPNVDVEIQEFKSGGLIFHKEVTPMLAVSFKKSQFSKLGIYFRAQQFGNVMFYSILETLDKSFWDAVTKRTIGEIQAMIKTKCSKNWAQWEEYLSLNQFGSLIFRRAMSALDPDFEKDKQLFMLNIATKE